MRALAIEHLDEDGVGAFAQWLPEAGLDLDVRSQGPYDLAGYDALVVMGGAMGVPDADTTHRYLHDEMALLRQAVAQGLPTLGVCLGAQLLAQACGGLVERGRLGPEIGLTHVHLTEAAERDPLLHDLPPIADAVQWHWDEIVTLPPHAAHLAATPRYPHQAFRVGDWAWGVQFHPEATPSMVARWARVDEADVRAAGEDPFAAAADVERAWPDLERTWVTVAGRFARLVQERADAVSNGLRTYVPHP